MVRNSDFGRVPPPVCENLNIQETQKYDYKSTGATAN